PDMLKIYPTLVIAGTELYKLYQLGQYQPYSESKIVSVIANLKNNIPYYVRIQRIQRDIPMDLIVDGVKHSNLRQNVQRYMASHGMHCKCIRCREEGFQSLSAGTVSNPVDLSDIQFFHNIYEASGGEEHFFSFENPSRTILIGYLRLRFPSRNSHRPEITAQKSAIVREIRVVGEIVQYNKEPHANQIQHRGFGKKLMKKAEEIARDHGVQKILVIAGIGVKEYFYRLGYRTDGPYVSKTLTEM
ncbi:MAG: GNAT family N-acetyltransferase, partial [Promethearchaeota archaeon]